MADPESTVINTDVKQVRVAHYECRSLISKAHFEMPLQEMTQPETLVAEIVCAWGCTSDTFAHV